MQRGLILRLAASTPRRAPEQGEPARRQHTGTEIWDQCGDVLLLESKYGGAGVSERKRLRELEAKNAKLKRMYADLALENTAIKDVLSRKL